MRLDDLPESGAIEDRRGEGYGGGGGGGGMGGLIPMGGGGIGIGTVVVLGLIGWALGIDPTLLISGADQLSRHSAPSSQMRPGQGPSRPTGSPTDEMGRFVNRVLGSTQATWSQIFAQAGGTYQRPILILYDGQTRAACGGAAQAAMGPFYCPVDKKIYLDTSFFKQIETRFRGCDAGSKGCQFAQAYVIAHEVGHHVQNQFGTLQKAQRLQQAAGGNRAQANHVQVQVELQADCYAGVWANVENKRLAREGKPPFIEPGDIEAALRTAAAIGDDTLQKRSQGYAVPDSFTHGSSEQRQRWFTAGFQGGTVASCNTFSSPSL